MNIGSILGWLVGILIAVLAGCGLSYLFDFNSTQADVCGGACGLVFGFGGFVIGEIIWDKWS